MIISLFVVYDNYLCFTIIISVYNSVLTRSQTSLLKTLLEKEKLPVTSNCSFPHSVFYPFG